MITTEKTWPQESDYQKELLGTVNVAGERRPALEVLYEAGSDFVKAGNLSELLDGIIAASAKVTGADRAYLVLLEKDTGVLQEVRSSSSHLVDTVDDYTEIRQSLIGYSFSGNQGVVVADIREVDPFDESWEHVDNVPLSVMVAPLRARGQIIGALYTESHSSSNRFGGRDLVPLEALANQAAMAIDNRRLQKEATASALAKNDHISIVNHQLRIPLTSISGYADLILSGKAGPLTNQQEQFLGRIKRNAKRMGALLADLSVINRIESGHAKFELSTFDLKDTVVATVGDLRQRALARQQMLVMKAESELPDVCADKAAVRRVLTILMTNAIYYTPDGGTITVRVRFNGQSAEIQIEDNGFGISEEDQQQLFTPFFRSEDQSIRQQVGWGLGLTVAKMVAEAQGGRITYKSELGTGTIFTFTLPLDPR